MSLARNTVLALTAVVTFGAAMASTTTPASAWHYPHWKKCIITTTLTTGRIIARITRRRSCIPRIVPRRAS